MTFNHHNKPTDIHDGEFDVTTPAWAPALVDEIAMFRVSSMQNKFAVFTVFVKQEIPVHSVTSRVRNLRKMHNFWAYFIDFEPEINIIKSKTEKLKQKT